jgi:hypothetical protein
MFEHLDDPNPHPPRALLVELVTAEGARRRRRRAVLAGGMAATLLVLAGGVRLAQAAGSGGDTDVKLDAPPADEPSPDPRGEGAGSGDELSTAPDQTDPVTTPSNTEAPTPSGTTTFAAITVDGLVVLADTDGEGAIVTELVDASADDLQLGTQVALSPDRQTVFFEATPDTGDEAGERAIYKVSTSGDGEPERIDTGTSPAVSLDGHLAYIQGAARILVRDLDTGDEQEFRGMPGSADDTLRDVAFTSDSQALVFTAGPPDGPGTLYYLDISFSLYTAASLNDATAVGPTDDAPEGTDWSTPDARASDGTIAVVESCCAPVLDSRTAFAFVEPSSDQPPADPEPVDGVSGTILQATYDSAGDNQLVLAVDGETYNLYLRQDGPLRRLDQAGAYTAIDW